MKTAEHWANLIQNDLRDDQSLADQSRFLRVMVRDIQADARREFVHLCKSCGQEISEHATSCPSCGSTDFET